MARPARKRTLREIRAAMRRAERQALATWQRAFGVALWVPPGRRARFTAQWPAAVWWKALDAAIGVLRRDLERRIRPRKDPEPSG